MKKLFWIGSAIVVLFSALVLTSQTTHIFCALDQTCAWTGPQTMSSVNAIINPTFFNGSDIGAQVNTAYASTQCGATGCRLRIPPNPSGGCWSYLTPILFNVSSKPAMIEGDPGGATCLTFTPSSGTAITFDYTAAHFTGWGIRDLAIYGACTNSGNAPNCSGVTSVGVSLGPSSGTDQQFISNVRIGKLGAGFATGLYVHSTFDLTSVNAQISGNNVGILNDLLVEHNTFIGGCICSNNTGVSMTATGSEMSFSNMSIDDNIVNGFNMSGNSTLTLDIIHFENAGCIMGCTYAATSDQWINAAAGKVFIRGGEVENDLPTGTVAQNMTFGGDTLDVRGLQEFVAVGHTVTNFWSLTNNSPNAIRLEPEDLVFGTRITNEYNSSFTGRLIYCPPLQVGSAEGPCIYRYYAQTFDTVALTGGGATTFTNTLTSAPSANRTSTLPDASITVSGAVFQDCGSTSGGTQACAGTVKPTFYVIRGDVLLNSAATQSITGLPFTAAADYSCSGSDLTNAAGIISFNTYATSSVTVQESGGGTSDHIRWQCSGF